MEKKRSLRVLFKKRYTERVECFATQRVTCVSNGTERRKDGKIERLAASRQRSKSMDGGYFNGKQANYLIRRDFWENSRPTYRPNEVTQIDRYYHYSNLCC